MSTNSYRLKHSIDSDEFEDQSKSTWCHRNWFRLLFVIILTVLTIGTISYLIIVLYKDALKEKALAKKKKDWIKKWKIIEPYVKHFPLGFMLGFIRNLIVLAIERYIDT
ncbi:unnamed protein product [Rotaria sp. Silwood1]|nr:unnamed protein product [Rotaria sp. Silwood1]CAF0955137.1 unnamed protein product [Rotaria sp. Silwood1]CAF1119744.1 unnamed protein product [Rotaria sp. Silwood1]CAF3355430.1 unnamed protein product [Rotaria sp. Silwood1]CAF3421078.1 unnamed protein product [Rotaria sp. Silwood1]